MSTKPQSAVPGALERLRQAARDPGPPTDPPGDVTDYDWSRPHHFTAAAHRRLGDFARRLQGRLGTALGHVLRTGAGLVADPPAECYPAAVDDDGANACYVPLRDADGHPCGALRFPGPLAAAWVERLLGGAPSARTGGEDLSPLEAGLLLDVASWMAKAVSEIASSAGTAKIQHEPTVTGWAEALPTDQATELCRFVFREADTAATAATPPNSQNETDADQTGEDATDTAQANEDAPDDASAEAPPADADTPDTPAPADHGVTGQPADASPAPALLLTSRFLEPLAEADPAGRSAQPDPDEFYRRLQSRIEAASVTVRAELGAASITLGDLLALEPGDVVVLDRARGETINLTVDGQVVLRARPATTAGHYAVEVQDLRRYPRVELAI